MAFKGAPGPFSLLHRHRLLSPNAGVKVSPLCIGGMSFGTNWSGMMGECDKDKTFGILDYFYSQGGNFIDTASNYQAGQSEEYIGEWMKSRDVRNEIVLATKFTTFYPGDLPEKAIRSNYGGNGAKALHVSVDASLKKLQTDYIDILYVHFWDFSVTIQELMQSLNHLVVAGKVLYLGISDTPAWIVSQANEYAKCHNLRPFSIYQGRWSASYRDFEREIVPMCAAHGMAIAPWGVQAGGNYKSDAQRSATEGKSRNFSRSHEDLDILVAKALNRIAERKKTIPTSVALAYVMHKTPYVFPVIGGRKIEYLKQNIEALSLRLSDEEMKEIESAAPFDVGFPSSFLAGNLDPGIITLDKVTFTPMAGTFDVVPPLKPIVPHQEE